MKRKIPKLVFNNNSVRKAITYKSSGNIHTLLVGLLILVLVIIIVMFNYRVNMLSEVFYNIDDNLTASALGAALPNKLAYNTSEEYDEVNQIILQDAQDTSIEESYTNIEQTVIASELNEYLIVDGGYDIDTLRGMTGLITGTTQKKIKTGAGYKQTNRVIESNESYTLDTVNNIVGLMYTNITEQTNATKISSLYSGGSSKVVTNELEEFMTLDKDDIVDQSFLGKYLDSNIEITRLQIYDIYRYTLAKRHVYASPFYIYSVKANGRTYSMTWDGYDINGNSYSPNGAVALSDGTYTTCVEDLVNKTDANSKSITISISGIQINSENELKEWIKSRYEDDEVYIVGENYPDVELEDSDFRTYKLLRTLWSRDLSALNYSEYLIFFEDTGITCQIDWFSDENTLNNKYGFLWNNQTYNAIPITNSVLMTDKSGRKLLPIEGYSVYFYTKGSNQVQCKYTSFYEENSMSYKARQPILIGDADGNGIVDDVIDITDNDFQNSSVFKYNKRTGTEIYSTSVYIEAAYDVILYPTGGTLLNLNDFSTKTVTKARLVSLIQK